MKVKHGEGYKSITSWRLAKWIMKQRKKLKRKIEALEREDLIDQYRGGDES